MKRKPYAKDKAKTAEHLLIREERVRAGITQEELAEMLDTTPVTVGRYETGDRGVSVEKLIEIAQALQVPPCRLIRDGDGLSAEERTLIEHLRANPKHRHVVQSTLQGLKDSEG